ncbi:MAG: hypothetical protein EOR60_09605 [Mesorhizobium sp.]|nr:MAG: hypothetical protein EOR60_09605 [Mesorhizobium sp.]
MPKAPATPQEHPVLPAPRWLTRAEKVQFRRVCEQMSAAGRPLSDADVDPIADLVTLRSRIADTRRIYRYAVDALKKNPAWRSDQSLALSTSRQLDAQTAKAQRMAAALGISKEAT